MSETGKAPVAYWAADAALQGLVSGYHRYEAAAPPGVILRDVLFPSWATIRISLRDTPPWTLRVGSRDHHPMPNAVMVGPTSHAGYITCSGGTLVGAGILPAGWARLFGSDASRYANRVVPLEQLDAGADLLVAALEAGESPAAAFDAWLTDRLAQRPPEDPRIRRLFALLDDPEMTRIEAIADALGLTPRALAAMTRYHFGFTPKLLLRRGRFLRALGAMLQRPGESAAVLEQAGYYDRSHFLRDSHLFLGCSIREFTKRRGPLNDIALRIREKTLGAAV
jgi:AraC-like DNA-binding protein